MSQDLDLRRKWTFRAHGKQVVFVKKKLEGGTHVFAKALLWALYLPNYPDLSVEIPIGTRYKPDLVQLADNGEPLFWGEAGRVSQRKMLSLVRRYRSTHLAFAKWGTGLEPFRRIIDKGIEAARRSAPVELISFPADSAERFIRQDGVIRIGFDNVDRLRW